MEIKIYNPEKGYGLSFFDETFVYCQTKIELLGLIDNILMAFNKQGLFEQLNLMQYHAGETEAFKNKYEIPSYFINLLLKEYHMKVHGY